MTVDQSLERYGMVPREEMLSDSRAILAGEVATEHAGRDRTDDLALLCAVQLFNRGAQEDILRIWEAKRASMDLGCALDVQLLCGAGLEATKLYLAGLPG